MHSAHWYKRIAECAANRLQRICKEYPPLLRASVFKNITIVKGTAATRPKRSGILKAEILQYVTASAHFVLIQFAQFDQISAGRRSSVLIREHKYKSFAHVRLTSVFFSCSWVRSADLHFFISRTRLMNLPKMENVQEIVAKRVTFMRSCAINDRLLHLLVHFSARRQQ